MKKTIGFLLVLVALSGCSEKREVKNVILLIPDGTSESVVTLSRWYKAIEEGKIPDSLLNKAINEKQEPALLCFEDLLCGMAMTHSANGLLSESAPAATEMSTGQKTDPGFLGISTDSVPYITNMELARIKKGKATGLVVTCEFPHATPAAFVSHCLDRRDYETIKKQMLYSQLDVVFGGGYGSYKVFKPGDKKTLEDLGYSVFNKFQGLGTFKDGKTWGLFNADSAYNGYMAFDLDRRTLNIKEPSLAEMTARAIKLLERNDEGFFLMVEGSKVDWAAHKNDPVGVVSEFLAFEKAVKVALDYAKENKNTVVIICADHGNGGFSIGNKFSDKKTNYNNNPKYIQYNHLPYKTIVNNLKKYELTGDGFERLLEKTDYTVNDEMTNACFKKYYSGFEDRSSAISDSINLYFAKKTSGERSLTASPYVGINNLISENCYLGWTTMGHTGEDVPLYMYHPNGYTLHGVVDNTQIAQYISEVLGLGKLDDETNKEFFSLYDLNKNKDDTQKGDTLLFKRGNDIYRFIINTNIYYKNEVKNILNTLNIKVNNKFYSGREVIKLLN